MTQLYAPSSYWQLSPAAKAEICNGCGTAGWKGRIIPDHLLWLSIQEACNIHDYMYHIGTTLADKDAADRVFLNNMMRIIESESFWLFKRPRRHLAVDYYGAVTDCGGPAFWADKNDPACMGAAVVANVV